MTDTPNARLPLATPCGTCDHTLNWHNTSGCTVTACGCGLFTAPTAGQRPAPMDPVRILGVEPDDTDPQSARQFRREPLLVLLSRMQRGVLLAAERPLLRAAVETELADGDEAHVRASQLEELLAVAEQAGNTAEAVRVELVADNERLRATLAALRDALTQCHSWTGGGNAFYREIRAILADIHPHSAAAPIEEPTATPTTLPLPGPALVLHEAAAKLRAAAEGVLTEMANDRQWKGGWQYNVDGMLGGPSGVLCGLLSPELALDLCDHLDATAVQAVKHARGYGNLQEEITDGFPTVVALRVLGVTE